jgi:hypothetical protein
MSLDEQDLFKHNPKNKDTSSKTFKLNARGTIIEVSMSVIEQSPVLQSWYARWKDSDKDSFFLNYSPEIVHKMLDKLNHKSPVVEQILNDMDEVFLNDELMVTDAVKNHKSNLDIDQIYNNGIKTIPQILWDCNLCIMHKYLLNTGCKKYTEHFEITPNKDPLKSIYAYYNLPQPHRFPFNKTMLILKDLLNCMSFYGKHFYDLTFGCKESCMRTCYINSFSYIENLNIRYEYTVYTNSHSIERKNFYKAIESPNGDILFIYVTKIEKTN